jgi:hypothetical protein
MFGSLPGLTSLLKYRSGLRYNLFLRDIWTAEFRYRPQGWEHPAPFVVIRRPVPDEPSAQLHLSNYGRIYLTSARHQSALGTAHGVGDSITIAPGPSSIRELKTAYVLNKIPMRDFGGTELFFQLGLLA